MIQITDNIYIGTTTEALNPELMDARHLKFKAILSCTTVVPPAVQGLPGILYGRIDVPDATPWSEEQIQHAAGFIEAGVRRGKIFVHSDLGISRCVAAVCFYLTRGKGASEKEAMAMIKGQYAEARPHQAILTGFTPVVKVTGKIPKPKAEIALSVVIVTWNRPEQAKACIGSVIERTTVPYELIVVDNGSHQETLKVLKSFKITLIELGRNFGKGAAANLGFRKSNGGYICYLDGDIEVPVGWFEEVKAAYEKLKKPGWITLPYEDTCFPEGSFLEGLYEAPSVEGGMVFMSREVYKEIGGFADNRLYGQIDTEYMAKARSRGLSVGYIDVDPEIVHLGKEDSPHYRDLKRLGVPLLLLKFPIIPETVDIVMVRYNLPDAEQECIDSVLEQTEWPYRLTTVDNYRRKERLTVLWNELIGESKCSQVCLLNSDCVVSKGWLTRLAATFMLDDKIAAVGPSTNMAASDQRIIESLSPAKIPTFARETGKKFSEQWEPCDITGFCYLLKKDVWREVGGFSPEFNLYGQEAEFNFRVTEKGYQVVWRKDAFVYHLGGASAQKASKKGEIDLEEEKNHASRTYAKLSTP